MSSLKEVRNRIASVKSTQQITNAMKMVSASKLRRAQNAIIKLRPYAAKLRVLMGNISKSLEDTPENIYTSEKKPEKILLVAIAGNRGLCGVFNSYVIKMVNRMIREKYAEQSKAGNVELICIGKKVSDYFAKRKFKIKAVYNDLLDNPLFEKTSEIASSIIKDFTDNRYDRIEIIYNQFKNAAVQILTAEQFLPVVVEPGEGDELKSEADYIFEPEKERIIAELLPKILKMQFYKALLDSLASEHGARMTAMHKATDNAQELIKELKLSYNKARQAAITNEILEIVGGAEALKG